MLNTLLMPFAWQILGYYLSLVRASDWYMPVMSERLTLLYPGLCGPGKRGNLFTPRLLVVWEPPVYLLR